MSNYIKVSIPKMKKDSDYIETNISRIPQFIHDLDDAMKNLGNCWEGPAWIMFQKQVASDILNMLAVYDWMHQFLQILLEAEKVYGNSEKKSFDCINKVRI